MCGGMKAGAPDPGGIPWGPPGGPVDKINTILFLSDVNYMRCMFTDR